LIHSTSLCNMIVTHCHNL